MSLARPCCLPLRPKAEASRGKRGCRSDGGRRILGYIPGMVKGERVSLTVGALDDDGAGVGEIDVAPQVGAPRAERLAVHVPFALPGEEVDARIVHRSPHRPDAWAELLSVRAPSPSRRPPACAAWGRCGGCVLQHL